MNRCDFPQCIIIHHFIQETPQKHEITIRWVWFLTWAVLYNIKLSLPFSIMRRGGRMNRLIKTCTGLFSSQHAAINQCIARLFIQAYSLTTYSARKVQRNGSLSQAVFLYCCTCLNSISGETWAIWAAIKKYFLKNSHCQEIDNFH